MSPPSTASTQGSRRQARPRKANAKVRVSMMIQPKLKETLAALAEAEGIGYQTLAHDILVEEVSKRVNLEAANPLERLALLSHGLRTHYLLALEAVMNLPSDQRRKIAQAVNLLGEVLGQLGDVILGEAPAARESLDQTGSEVKLL